ncbi:DUF1499 domain-containing protein [Desulfoplanes sp.]
MWYWVAVSLALFLVGGCFQARADNLAVSGANSPDQLGQCPDSPNCVFSGDRNPAQKIFPMRLTSNGGWHTLRKHVAGMPRTAIVKETPTYIHATVSSRVFGFVDDLEFLLDPETRLVGVRSSSRTGYWDFGVNRRRVEKIRTTLYEWDVIVE